MPQVWGVLLTGRNRLISPARANLADSTELLATCGPDLPWVGDRTLPYFGSASGGRRRGDPGAPARVARG